MSPRPKKNHLKEKTLLMAKKIRPDSGKKPKMSLQTGSFRIIGGLWRSRRLSFPAIEGLRPTTDRVRETVFNWLTAEIQGAHVLDVFAGSGALGLEALSRGATSLLAIEKDKHAAKALQGNIDLLTQTDDKSQHSKVQNVDALAFLEQLKIAGKDQIKKSISPPIEVYDLVFLDPPFRKGLLEETLTLLDGHPLIQHGALIYVEREQEMRNVSFPSDWTLLKEKVAGQVLYQLFRVNG